MKEISSLHNPLIKKLLLLQEKSKLRKEENLFVIDGLKEIKMALKNHFVITHLFFPDEFKEEILQLKINAEHILVSDLVFDKIAYRGSTSKAVAIVQQRRLLLENIFLPQNPLFIVIDGVEKPGNIGAMLRIADAANVTAVLISDIKTDLFNPNVIRSSVGCIFSNQIVVETKENIFTYLTKKQTKIYTTSLKASKNYLECDYTQASAFVVGTEADGVDEFWEEQSFQNIIIPMSGQNDSLNVSNALAIVTFEALRQRN